jgi:hypothetical protein
MLRTVLIRLGGLVATVCGLAATTLGLLYVLQERGMALGFVDKAVRTGAYEGPLGTMLLVGALAAVAALHLKQRRSYGTLGALASASAIGGIAMVVIGFLCGHRHAHRRVGGRVHGRRVIGDSDYPVRGVPSLVWHSPHRW